MKNLGEIKESKDITTKEYVDGKMVIIDNTDIIEKINSGFDGYNPYVFNVSELLTEDEKNKLKNADAVQLALEKLGGNSYYRIALHKTENEEYFQGTGIVTSTINDVNTMSFVIFVSYSLMQIKPLPIGYANTNPNIFGDSSYVNKNYVNNQISTAGDGKFLPLVDGGRITNSEHPSLTGTLISSTGIAVDGDNEPHARYGTEAYFYQKSEASDAMTEISYSGVYISKGGANKELTGLHPNLLEFKSSNGVVSGLATPTTNTQAANKAYVDALGTRVSTNEDNIAMAESDIESLQTDVTTLKTGNTANQAAIKTLQDTYVPNTRKINNKSLDNDIILTASDVGAISQTSADDRYLKLSGGTIANNTYTLNINPDSLQFSTTGVEFNASGILNLSTVGQNNGVIKGLANPTQDDYAANKAYVDSLSFSVLDTVVNSFTNVDDRDFIFVIDLDSDNIDFANSNSPIIYFQYLNHGLKETLNQNIERIFAQYDIYLDIPNPTTERYPLYKLPEPLSSMYEADSTTIYYSSGIIYLESVEQILIPFIVLAGNITKSSEGYACNRLIFINLRATPSS